MHALYPAVEGARGAEHIRDRRLYRRMKTACPLTFRSHVRECMLFERLILIDLAKLLCAGLSKLLGNAGRDAVIFSLAHPDLLLQRKFFVSVRHSLELQRITARVSFQARACNSVPDFALRIRREEYFVREPLP